MPAFCLTKDAVDKFKKGLIAGVRENGDLHPKKLAVMTSDQRRIVLEKYVGKENATQVNGLFESKLLLKNQKAGYLNWAKRVGGISRIAKRDLIARIEKLDTVLNPIEEKAFLHDLVAQRLGTEVSAPEAKQIFDLSQRIQELQKQQDPKTLEFSDKNTRLDYGASKITLLNYVSDLKNEASKLSPLERAKPKNLVRNISDLAGVAKALKASFDDSAIFRQGWKTLWTHPTSWTRNAAKTFTDFAKTLKDKDEVINGVMADLISRPNSERYKTAKLALGNMEEAFPTTLPGKVPIVGRIYKASETAFTGFVYRQRADVFDSYMRIAEKSGLDINDPVQLKAIGKLVNSLTGRGDIGRLEPVSGVLNNVFFSPRLLKSNIDLLTAHSFDRSVTSFARKQAAINLVKVISGTAAVLTIAHALNPNSVETDPRSSDFGKIRVGNTRFDVTGGMGSVVTLAMRMISGMSKSSTTGKLTNLDTGLFGEPTRLDMVINFFENKFSPAATVVKELLSNKDFNGNKPTVGGELSNLFVPLPVTNYMELKGDPNAAPLLLSILADSLGISVNTYGKSQATWEQSTSKKLLDFKAKVGDTKFQQANAEFNTKFDAWTQKTYRDPRYQNLSDSAKQALITRAKAKIETAIFKENQYKYHNAKPSSQDKQTQKQLLQL